ncbi:MAG: hypothetical protein Q9204_006381 [Flavoplaca sp. TL-2023a]
MDASLKDRLVYQPLDQDLREIRILTILPGARSAPIECTLENAPLFDVDEYEALSYTWGDPKSTTEIFVNGRSFPATLNLAAALVQLRARHCFRLWIDAVCIDQNNRQEKGLQVLRMESIYRKANGTIVWLGNQEDDSDLAFEALKAMSEDPSDKQNVLIPEDIFTAGSPTRAAIKQLFRRPYWRRVRIIQEVSVSETIIVCCGKASIKWDRLEFALKAIISLNSEDENLAMDFKLVEDYFLTLYRFRLTMTQDRPLDLLSALNRSGSALATCQRDRVFALLGITLDGNSYISDPNYKQDDRSVFIDMAKARLVHTRVLDMICLKAYIPSNTWNLPSWIPDWLNLGQVFPRRMTDYLSGCGTENFVINAFGKSPYTHPATFNASAGSIASFRMQDSKLKVRGIILDTIDGLSSALDPDSEYKPNSVYSNMSQSTSSSPNAYGTKGALFDSLFRTMSEFPNSMHGLPHDRYKSTFSNLMTPSTIKLLEQSKNFNFKHLLVWLDRNKNFLIGDQTMEEYLTGSTRPVKSFIARAQKRLFKRSHDTTYAFDLYSPEVCTAAAVRVVVQFGTRIITTKFGLVGRTHPAARKGDGLALLAGCSFPVILRPSETVVEQFQVIGDAYVEGWMNGDMWNQVSTELDDIILV